VISLQLHLTQLFRKIIAIELFLLFLQDYIRQDTSSTARLIPLSLVYALIFIGLRILKLLTFVQFNKSSFYIAQLAHYNIMDLETYRPMKHPAVWYRNALWYMVYIKYTSAKMYNCYNL